MIKKQHAQKGEKGISVTARGYAMKARPGPEMQQHVSIILNNINVDLHLISSNVLETSFKKSKTMFISLVKDT